MTFFSKKDLILGEIYVYSFSMGNVIFKFEGYDGRGLKSNNAIDVKGFYDLKRKRCCDCEEQEKAFREPNTQEREWLQDCIDANAQVSLLDSIRKHSTYDIFS